jgi:peptide-O-fucosyltransferase
MQGFCPVRNYPAIFSLFFSLCQIDLLIHFNVYSNAKKPSCFYPIPQAADCILRVIERADAPIIYLSTDAAESETGLLQKLIVLNGKPVPLVIRPARNSAEKWDALLYRHGIEGDSQVR